MSYWTGTEWEQVKPAPKKARPSRIRHALEAVTEGTLIAALAVGMLAGATFAASGRTASDVWVDELGGARAAGLARGSHFTVGYASREREPWAFAVCFANDTSVLSGSPKDDGSIWGAWFSVYPGGPNPQDFVLGESVTPTWVGGGADCEVQLVKLSGKYNGALGFSNATVLARTTFTAVP